MGLFDVFGAGGGSAAIQIAATMVGAGTTLEGNVVFTGGKRAQQITNITMRVSQSMTSMQMTKEGPRQHTQSRDVVPSFQITGATTSTPGQPQAFPFSINIPAGAPPSQPGHLTYSLHANVDIPGEIDAGASVPITVVGAMGAQMPMQQAMMPMQQPMMPMQQAMMPMQQPMMPMQPMGYPQQAQMPPPMGYPQQAQMPPQPMGYPQMPPPMVYPPMPEMPQPQMGSFVVALHPSGNWAAGRVTAMQNGMIGVDWDDPMLGASTWVSADQVRVK